MNLSSSSIAMLIDMVENRISDMVVTDREDAREQQILRRTLQELAAMSLTEERSSRRRPARRSASFADRDYLRSGAVA